MVHAMANDRGRLPRVAWLLSYVAVTACGPTVRPDRPFPDEPVERRERAPTPARGGRQVVVGELCLQSAAGRPAVAPLLLHTNQWIDAAAEVTAVIERGQAARFAVFDVDGKVAGTFGAIGLADITLGQSVAAGSYVGAPPCSQDIGGQRSEDAKCKAATNGCGLAVSELTRPDEPADPPAFVTAGACVVNDALGIDIDGDGVTEWFPLSGALDGIRGPAQEWSSNAALSTTRASCTPRFAQYDLKLAPEAEPGKPANDKAVVTLDVLGVVDLDGDDRKELVLALRFPTVRTVVVYSASGSPQRLELVGEAQSFQTK